MISVDPQRLGPDVLAELVIDAVAEFGTHESQTAGRVTQLGAWARSLPPEMLERLFALAYPAAKVSAPPVVTRKAKPAAKLDGVSQAMADHEHADDALATLRTKKPAATRDENADEPLSAEELEERILATEPLDSDLPSQIVDLLRNGPLGTEAIREQLLLTPGQAKGALKRLKDAGRVRVEGAKRNAKYVLTGQS